MTAALRDYQWTMVDYIVQHPRCNVFASMGLGNSRAPPPARTAPIPHKRSRTDARRVHNRGGDARRDHGEHTRQRAEAALHVRRRHVRTHHTTTGAPKDCTRCPKTHETRHE